MSRPRRPSPQTMQVLDALAADPTAWRHGYELGAEVGLRSGSLYPILVRLCDRGLLEAKWEGRPPRGRPPRHLYRLTSSGLEQAADTAGSFGRRGGKTVGGPSFGVRHSRAVRPRAPDPRVDFASCRQSGSFLRVAAADGDRARSLLVFATRGLPRRSGGLGASDARRARPRRGTAASGGCSASAVPGLQSASVSSRLNQVARCCESSFSAAARSRSRSLATASCITPDYGLSPTSGERWPRFSRPCSCTPRWL